MNTDAEVDHVVVGAGFAGLVAARELSRAGRSVTVLEARDRIGGRTWLTERMGLDLELGGTWVHWTQPYVWSELGRYGIGVVPSPHPSAAVWWTGTNAVRGSFEDLLAALEEGNTRFSAPAREVFPFPFDPLRSSSTTELDDLSVADYIDGLELEPTQRALLRAFWTLNFNGHLHDAALTQALRWIALSNGDWKLNWEACASLKIQGGTRRLIEAIRQDSAAELVTGTDVQEIDASDDVVTVTAHGRRWRTRSVIITSPLGALGRIRFTPPLPTALDRAGAAGQIGRGAKVWFTLQGEVPHFVALGSADWPLTFFQSEYHHEGNTYAIAFGPDGRDPDLDAAGIREVLSRLLPDVVVLETSTHSWVDDPFARETWPMHRRGFLRDALPRFQRFDGRVAFAGSDYATGWGGFIDGAIESGLRAARDLLQQPAVART